MIEEDFVIKNKFGFHLKPLNELVRRISQFNSSVKVIKDDQMADGKSLLDLLTLCVAKNDKIKVIVEGEDEQEVIKVIRDFIEHDIFQYDSQYEQEQK
jgi:phosphocarrier protein HPr